MLGGGLGNQLFQYAFARAVALRSNARLVLDTKTLFRSDHRYKRSYALEPFSFSNCCSTIDRSFVLQKARGYLHRCLDTLSTTKNKRIVKESNKGHYDARFANLVITRDTVFIGYWQCPRYFEDYASIIREDLTFKEPICPQHADWENKINNTHSVAIHVRRQDFWSKLSSAYYRKSIERIRTRFTDAHFYVFTDDPEWWLREMGNIQKCDLVSEKDTRGIDDFQLMSKCRHFIIANSSFSWWAAWLGNHPEKHVIAPSKEIWFDSWDVLPDDWDIIAVEKDTASRKSNACSFTFQPVEK